MINESGVLGQVTRVYPLSSEVTLLADRTPRFPVLNALQPAAQRRLRRAHAGMELRFMAGNADVQAATCSPPRAWTVSIRRVCRWRR